MKAIVWLITILILGLGVSGQAPTPKPMTTPVPKAATGTCDLGLDKAPTLRGLRLGMMESEADKLLGGGLSFDLRYDDWTRTAIAVPKDLPDFDGVKWISLTAYDGKIYDIKLTYEMKFDSPSEFGYYVIPKLELPMTGWKRDAIGVYLPCKDFLVTLATIGDSSAKLTDVTTVKRIEDGRKKAEEEKKKAFKP